MPSAELVGLPFGPAGSFFESPRWHDGSWWVSDMFGNRVLSLDSTGDILAELRFDDHPSGLGWLPDGRLLVVLMAGQALVAVDTDGTSTAYADLSGFGRGPANDLVTDGSGRVWVGYLGFDMASGERPATTDLVRIDADRTVSLAASGLMTPNGAVVIDGSTLLIAETLASRITAFTIATRGELTDRRKFVQLAPEPPYDDLKTCFRALRSAPDGVGADADGRLWVADAAGGGCVQFDKAGQAIARVPSPDGAQSFACSVGGPDGRSLLVCCAPDAVESRRAGHLDGRLYLAKLPDNPSK